VLDGEEEPKLLRPEESDATQLRATRKRLVIGLE
jgi:hypothetical protein